MFIHSTVGWAVEYFDCISAADRSHPYSKCHGYDIKLYDGEVSVLELWV